MPVDRPTAAGAGTEVAQFTGEASSFGRHVFPAQALRMQTPWPHDLIGRTTIGVTQRIVAKVFFRINAFAALPRSIRPRASDALGSQTFDN